MSHAICKLIYWVFHQVVIKVQNLAPNVENTALITKFFIQTLLCKKLQMIHVRHVRTIKKTCVTGMIPD